MRQTSPIIIILLALAACFTATPKAQAQSVAVKTNLLYDATLTPNLGVEMGLGKRTTAQLSYGLNPWKFSEGKSMRHWQLMGEGRYWFCSKFNGHFLGVHTPYLLYNVADIKWLGTEGERHQGWGAGAGISYGYSWLLSRHWNLEATVGVGYLYLKSDKYPCANCGRKQEGIKKHYFGPTQAAINLIYQF